MRIIAYDPSFINLGVAFGVSSPGLLTVRSVSTYKIDQLLNKTGTVADWSSTENQQRMGLLKKIMQYTLTAFQPDLAVLERPVYNRLNPDSLIKQSTCLGVMESELQTFFCHIGATSTTTYLPNAIKAGVGVPKEKYKDKDAITEALENLMKNNTLCYEGLHCTPREVDDHANDAVAMLYVKHVEVQHELV